MAAAVAPFALSTAQAATVEYGFTGSLQTWSVPVEVVTAAATLTGGQGANSPDTGEVGPAEGGQGAQVSAVFEIPAETTQLNVYVGGSASGSAGGWNGGGDGGSGDFAGDSGGGGGGASSISQTDGTPILVAGGGGGAGGFNGEGDAPGNGGDAGTGTDGVGSPGSASPTGEAGGAAGIVAGGAGGAGGTAPSDSNSGGGGGGGAGFNGGGGGSAGGSLLSASSSGGGGGAGSSFAAVGTSNVSYETAGDQPNGGSVQLTWIDMSPTALGALAVGSSASIPLSSTYSGGSITWSVVGGQLPQGLTLNGSAISGTPIATENYQFTLQAADPVAGLVSQLQFSGTVTGAPTVTVQQASSITAHAATGNGQVNPGNEAVTSIECRVAADPAQVASGKRFPATPSTLTASDSPTPVTCGMSGLISNTEYHYAFYATNASGTGNSIAEPFTTATQLPTVSTEPAQAITPTTAIGVGTVNPHLTEADLSCRVATSIAGIAGSTAVAASPSPTAPVDTKVAAICAFTGLAPDTTYYYRFYAENEAGENSGSVQSFTTGATAPIVTVGAATDVGYTSATGTGTVTATNDPIDDVYCRVASSPETVTSGTRVTATPSTVDAAAVAVPVSCGFTGLTPGTTYYYQVFAVDSAGTGTGQSPATFTTALSEPVISVGTASVVSSTSAIGHATVSTSSQAVSSLECRVASSPDTVSSGKRFSATPATVAPQSFGVAVECPLANLTPNSTYYYAVIAVSSGQHYSSAVSDGFTTPGAVPTVSGATPTAVGTTAARIRARVTANNSSVSGIECRISTSPSDVDDGVVFPATPAAVPASADRKPVTCAIEGLDVDTVYYVRAYATNAVGTAAGAGASFTTSASPPMVTTQAPTNVTSARATGHATVTATGEPVTDIGCAYSTNAGSVGQGTVVAASPSSAQATAEDVPVACALTGLQPNTTYYYSAFASDADGTAWSTPVVPFTTAAITPSVTGLTASSITVVTAQLTATINPQNSAVTSVYCQVSTSISSLSQAPRLVAQPASLGPSMTPQKAVCPVSHLTAGQPYFWQLTAVGSAGTTSSSPASFTTAGRSGPPVVPPQKIKKKGKTVLLSGPSYSTSGQRIGVTLKVTPRGAAPNKPDYRVVRKNGRVAIKTYGHKLRVTVIYRASAPAGGSGYKLSRTYRT